MFFMPCHSISLQPISNDYSISVPARDPIFFRSDEGSDMVFAPVECPYCWVMRDFIASRPGPGEQLVIDCEKTRRKFPLEVIEMRREMPATRSLGISAVPKIKS